MSTSFAPIAEVETLNLANISEKTVFLSVSFNRFGNSRKANVEVVTSANQKRFRTSKKLLESPELETIRKADTAFRIWLDSPIRCWSYGKAGLRMVPWTQFEEVYEACKQYQKVDRPKLVDAFIATYLDRIAEAKVDLKEQADDVDFPSIEEVRDEFSFTFEILNFGTPDKLKVISPKAYQEEKEKAHQQFVDAAVELRNSMRFVFDEMVNHLLDILSPSTDGKKKKIYDTTVTKLQDFLNTFDLRNVTDDAELQDQVGKLKLIMAGVDAEKLRESDNLKVDIAAKLQEAKAGMVGLVQTKFRKFK